MSFDCNKFGHASNCSCRPLEIDSAAFATHAESSNAIGPLSNCLLASHNSLTSSDDSEASSSTASSSASGSFSLPTNCANEHSALSSSSSSSWPAIVFEDDKSINRDTSPRPEQNRDLAVLGSLGAIPNDFTSSSVDMCQKRQQARLLLVSLIENFCALYNPSAATPLFTLLCSTLVQMGIFTHSDVHQDMIPLRRLCSSAFRTLVNEAMATLANSPSPKPVIDIPRSSCSFTLDTQQKPLLFSYSADCSRSGLGSSQTSNSDRCGACSPARDPKEPKNSDKGSLVGALFRGQTAPFDLTLKKNPLGRTNSQRRRSNISAESLPPTAFLELLSSRYLEDFNEIGPLGRGGFGSVWHVRHNLDGGEYAVKKIRLAPIRHIQVALKEAKVLAAMDSPNIVRYHCAWLELEGKNFAASQPDHGSETFSLSTSNVGTQQQPPDLTGNPAPFNRPLVLFIQMELCKSTLSEYLRYRNIRPAQEVASECDYIFRSLLLAVSYIHKRGLAHRDLTPKNIFLVPRCGSPQTMRRPKVGVSPLCDFMRVSSLEQVIVKVGDFGLVAEETPSSNRSSPSSMMMMVVPSGSMIGTPLYSAPELCRQLESKKQKKASSLAIAHGTEDVNTEDSNKKQEDSGDEDENSNDDGKDKEMVLGLSIKANDCDENQQDQPKQQHYRNPPLVETQVGVADNAIGSVVSEGGNGTTDARDPESGIRSSHITSCDMYSLGVILLELLCPFSTGMERSIILGNVRSQRIPEAIIKDFPLHATIVLWLTAEHPGQRPTPDEIFDFFPAPMQQPVGSSSQMPKRTLEKYEACSTELWMRVNSVRSETQKKDEIITRLTAELAAYKIAEEKTRRLEAGVACDAGTQTE